MNYIKLAVYKNGFDEAALERIFLGEATQCFRKGEEMGSGYTCSQDSWILEHNLPGDVDINDALDGFIAKHMKNSEAIKELSTEGEVVLTLGMYPDEEQLDFVLSSENMSVLASCGAQLSASVMFLNIDI